MSVLCAVLLFSSLNVEAKSCAEKASGLEAKIAEAQKNNHSKRVEKLQKKLARVKSKCSDAVKEKRKEVREARKDFKEKKKELKDLKAKS